MRPPRWLVDNTIKSVGLFSRYLITASTGSPFFAITLAALMPSLPTAAFGLPAGSAPHRSRVSRTPGNWDHSEVPSVATCTSVSFDRDNIAAFSAWWNATRLPSETSVGCSTLWIIEKPGPDLLDTDSPPN